MTTDTSQDIVGDHTVATPVRYSTRTCDISLKDQPKRSPNFLSFFTKTSSNNLQLSPSRFVSITTSLGPTPEIKRKNNTCNPAYNSNETIEPNISSNDEEDEVQKFKMCAKFSSFMEKRSVLRLKKEETVVGEKRRVPEVKVFISKNDSSDEVESGTFVSDPTVNTV